MRKFLGEILVEMEVCSDLEINASDPDDVIRFWFEELTARDWFVKSDQVDEQIRSRFLALHQKLAGQPSAPAGPRATLATVIVLDQFSRNLFRNSAQAFAADAMALQIARDAVARGLDQAFPHNQRLFLYLPFEHSELQQSR